MAVTARALNPALLIREATSPRVFVRGEEYFASGAVLRVDEPRPGLVVAKVAGSSDRPYHVEVRYDEGRVRTRCTCPFDWEPVCKHAVAASLATRATAPLTHPNAERERLIAKAIEREQELRRNAAKSERFTILARPGRERATFSIRSARTRQTYDVFVSADVSFCTCADFLTSELGPCKHIIKLSRESESRRPLTTPAVFLQSRETRGVLHDPLRDIRVVFPKNRPPTAFAALLDEGGHVDPTRRPLRSLPKAEVATRLERALASLPAKSIVRPEVRGLLREVREREERGRRMDAFATRVRSALSRNGAPAPEPWRKAIEPLRVRLHPYQVDGVLFAARAGRALIADDMGLGKTMQALAAMRLLQELGEVKRTLVVCPASLKHQWAREAKKAFGLEFPAVVVDGGRAARRKLYASPDATMLIVNYEVLIRDQREVRAAGFDLVVLDEAQRIKNWSTRTAKAVKAVQTPFAFVLTGTPLENRLTELQSIAEYLDLRVLGPAWRLVPEFGRFDAMEKLIGFTGLDLIRKRLGPYFIRRERSLVLSQLPPRSEKTYRVPFTAEQKVPHDDCIRVASQILAKKHLTEADILKVMSSLTTARMLANGAALAEFRQIEDEVRRGLWTQRMAKAFPSPKLSEFAQVLEDFLEEKSCKLVVFSQWERMLRLAAAAARPVIAAAGVRPIFFHGALNSRERAEAIADFHGDPRARVFFSTDAGGVGLNLQEAASVVVHLEVPWNPAVIEQRIGRVHRMGQRHPVRVVHFVSEGSIEERISLAVQHKRELFDGLFRGTSDEITFGDGTGGNGLRDRLKALVGAKGASPSLGDIRRAVDKPAPAALPAVPPELFDVEVLIHGTTPQPPANGMTFDAGPFVAGLLQMLAPSASAVVPGTLPVTISRDAGRLRLELPEVPASAWASLAAFAQGMAQAPAVPWQGRSLHAVPTR